MKTKTKQKSWMAKCIDEMLKNPDHKGPTIEYPGYMINGVEYDPVKYRSYDKKRDYYVFVARSDVIRTYPVGVYLTGYQYRHGGGVMGGELTLAQNWWQSFDWSVFKQPVLYPDPDTNTYVPFNPEVHA